MAEDGVSANARASEDDGHRGAKAPLVCPQTRSAARFQPKQKHVKATTEKTVKLYLKLAAPPYAITLLTHNALGVP